MLSRLKGMVVGFVAISALVAPLAAAATPEQLFEQLYGRQYRDAQSSTDTADDLALAGELVHAAKQSEDAPTIVLLTEKAYQLTGEKLDGLAVSVEAMRLQAAADPDNAAKANERLIDLLPRYANTATGEAKTEAGQLLVTLLLARVDQHLAAEQVDEAITVARQAMAVANGLPADTQADAKAAYDRATNLRRTFLQVDALKRRIADSPFNPKLHDQLATLYLTELDAPAKAAALREKVSSAMAKKLDLLAAEPDKLTDADLIILGEWYGDDLYRQASPDARPKMLQHAIAQYETILNRQDVAELTRIKAQTSHERLLKRLNAMTEPTATAGKEIDLLKQLDLDRDVVSGNWSKTREGVTYDAKSKAMLVIARKVARNFDLSIRFTVHSGTGAPFVMLPVGDSQAVLLCVGGWGGRTIGLDEVNGKRAKANETTMRIPEIPANRPLSLDVSLREDGGRTHITARLGSRKIVDWTGPTASLALNSMYKAPGDRAVMLVFPDDTSMELTELKLDPSP